jgi:hypothetical protein
MSDLKKHLLVFISCAKLDPQKEYYYCAASVIPCAASVTGLLAVDAAH